MANRSPIPRIQFAQSHRHLSENKWEDGRGGWGERRGMWQHSATLTMGGEKTDGDRDTDRQTDRRMLWLRKIPSSNETKRLIMTASQAWDNGNSLPAGGWQLFICWVATETERMNGKREREGWENRMDGLQRKTNRAGRKISGQTGMSSARLSILSQSEK